MTEPNYSVNELAVDYFEDFNLFKQWIQEEFSLTNQAIVVHAELVRGKGTAVDSVMRSMYWEWCPARS